MFKEMPRATSWCKGTLSPMMNTAVSADPRLRKRALILVLTSFVAGALLLSFFHGFLQDIEALATASPQLAFEKLSLIRNATLGFTLVCSTALVGLFAYISFRVFRAAQWPSLGGRVVWEMPVRTGRRATAIAVFLLFLAVVVIADAVWLWSLPEPVPQEQVVPMEDV